MFSMCLIAAWIWTTCDIFMTLKSQTLQTLASSSTMGRVSRQQIIQLKCRFSLDIASSIMQRTIKFSCFSGHRHSPTQNLNHYLALVSSYVRLKRQTLS